jgi:hypothetical protein
MTIIGMVAGEQQDMREPADSGDAQILPRSQSLANSNT